MSQFSKLIIKLKNRGYTERVDLFGAPIDWRLGLAGLNSTFGQLKQLVEKAYTLNGEKVVILGHSFGGMIEQYFLDTFSQKDWARKYINSAVFIAYPSLEWDQSLI
jgi:triacylglycerol esterase/lipase EstA (alpha/beta hydrolase family)